MWLWIHRTTKVRSLTQQPSNSQAWAGPQPHMPERPPSPLTQNVGVGWVREVWLFPSVSMGSTDGRVVPQKTRPSHAVCGEVSKEGRTARERHMVSSKTEGTKTLGALRREASLASQCSGQVLVLSSIDGHCPGLSLYHPQPPPHPSAPGPIPAHALQIYHLRPGLMRADVC